MVDLILKLVYDCNYLLFYDFLFLVAIFLPQFNNTIICIITNLGNNQRIFNICNSRPKLYKGKEAYEI